MENANQNTTAARPYRRKVRNIFIHRPMQREFTLIIFCLLMVSTLAIGFVVHDTIHQAAFGGGFQFGRINPYEVLQEVRYQLILKISLILIVTIIVVGIFGIFFLHRVAGPVYRFHRIFMRVNDGEIRKIHAPLKIREADYFQETMGEINRLLKRMQHDAERLETIKNKMDQALKALPNAPEALREVRRLADEEYVEN